MSSADLAVRVFRSLANEDLRVLQVLETAMSEHEYVSREQVARFTGFDLMRDTDFRLARLSRLGLIYRMTGPYIGYTLNYAGYDVLAINGLVKSDVIRGFGTSLGVGKEADVYDALGSKDERIAVKFHRLGRISFRQTVRKRGYTTRRASGWLHQSRLAAEKEFMALKMLFPAGVAVPEPIQQNRHVIVMGMIEGGELANWKRIRRPARVVKEVLRNVRWAYLRAGIIHADLSEYNIILKENMRILIIDWPQFVTSGHPNAADLSKRDVENLLNFFRRKHNIRVNSGEALRYVRGEIRNITF